MGGKARFSRRIETNLILNNFFNSPLASPLRYILATFWPIGSQIFRFWPLRYIIIYYCIFRKFFDEFGFKSRWQQYFNNISSAQFAIFVILTYHFDLGLSFPFAWYFFFVFWMSCFEVFRRTDLMWLKVFPFPLGMSHGRSYSKINKKSFYVFWHKLKLFS